jgi:alpha-amylase
MKTSRPGETFRDMTGHVTAPITTDVNGEAEFRCPPGKLSIWCMC